MRKQNFSANIDNKIKGANDVHCYRTRYINFINMSYILAHIVLIGDTTKL